MTIAGSRWTLAALFALAACSPPAPTADPAPPREAAPAPAAPAPPSLLGQWRIVEVDGTPARPSEGEAARLPQVTFSAGRYGGSTGCNSFGGNGLMVGERWFADPPLATQQGCGDLTRQERAIFAVLAGGPTIAWQSADAATLRTPAGTLRLRRTGSAPVAEETRPAPLLAGTRWDLRAIDGIGIELPGARAPARLTLEAEEWTLDTPCASRKGAWRQEADAIVLEAGTVTARACPARLEPPSRRAGETIAGRMRFVTGQNGEIVLSNGHHWITGGRDLSFGGSGQQALSGRWRIEAVDGRGPPASERPAELAFGPGAFAVWDGCRHSEGVAIVEDRQLFTHGSGMVTMANCPADPLREAINAVVAASPRIAFAGDRLALISHAGTLRLQKSASPPFGTGVETKLRSGLAFDLAGARGASGRLTLGPGDRFTVALTCGSFDGRWRHDRAPDGAYARFGPERPPAGCGDDPGPAAIYNFFTGDVRAAIGPNRDIVLFVNRGQRMAARLVSGGSR